MAHKVIREAGSAFRIRRPLITANGFLSNLDPRVKNELDELNELLGKRAFDPASALGASAGMRADFGAAEKTTDGDGDSGSRESLHPALVLTAPLAPRWSRGSATTWRDRSLAAVLHEADEDDENVTLSEWIEKVPELATLRYAFDDVVAKEWTTLPYNAKAILSGEYGAIRDYLVAYAYLVGGLTETHALRNFVLGGRYGVANVADYASVSAARQVIKAKALKVKDYDVDRSEIVTDIRAADLPLSSVAFETGLLKIVNSFVFDDEWEDLIAAAKIGPIPAGLMPQLVRMVKSSPVPITAQNVKYFLPLFITQLSPPDAGAAALELDVSDREFDVEFFEDDHSTVEVSKTAVKCAAQLYYAMVLGDELGVFDVVDYFTRRYLLRSGLEIRDATLREDLQEYAFNGRFTDLRFADLSPRRLEERTRRPERHMFYRQVFDEGDVAATEDQIVNEDFQELWKVLILQSAEYLERAQASPHPDSFVSRQQVMQAVEDLQYNLSTYCTGMAMVITPLIYAELDFVIERIFKHPEVLEHFARYGRTWWRVVEGLAVETRQEAQRYMPHELQHSRRRTRRARPRALALNNKAKLGHKIIASMADYNPATFQEDAEFSEFISNIDAFITTQSILQEALTDDIRRTRDEAGDEPPREAGSMPPPVPVGGGTNGTPASDEWDF